MACKLLYLLIVQFNKGLHCSVVQLVNNLLHFYIHAFTKAIYKGSVPNSGTWVLVVIYMYSNNYKLFCLDLSFWFVDVRRTTSYFNLSVQSAKDWTSYSIEPCICVGNHEHAPSCAVLSVYHINDVLAVIKDKSR